MINIHELHIWQISNHNYVATIHLVVDSNNSKEKIERDSTNVLIKNGIFSSTIQIENSEYFPAGINQEESCFYASSFGSNKRCFISHPVYQHGIGCPYINLTNIGEDWNDDEIEPKDDSADSTHELA
jgi:hypothetical protein